LWLNDKAKTIESRAVLFDLDDTLTSRRETLLTFAGVFASDFAEQLNPIELEALSRQIIEIDRGGYNPRRPDDLKELLAWREVPTSDFLEKYWQRRFSELAVPRLGMFEVLETLKSNGFRLGVVTNGEDYGQNRKVDYLSLRTHVDSIVISGVVGCKKPDPAIFDHACRELEVEASQCWFVGDHPVNDVVAARQVGMRSVWIRDDHTSHEWPEGEAKPGYEIGTLLELLEIMELAN